jgi:hypothetical protein
MTASKDTTLENIASPLELESLRHFENVGTLRAKQAAGNFAKLVGLDADSREYLIGVVAVHTETMEFEDRNELANRFHAVSEMLGGLTTPLEKPDLKVVEPSRSRAEVFQEKHQLKWLSSLFGVEAASAINAMPFDEKEAVVSRIGLLYQGLTIRRLNNVHKKIRSDQLRMFFAGKSYDEIVEATGAPSVISVKNGIDKMAESIITRTTENERLAVLAY